MAHYSDIEWTHSTWNPVTGCNPVSDELTGEAIPKWPVE
jgi:protein gp37